VFVAACLAIAVLVRHVESVRIVAPAE